MHSTEGPPFSNTFLGSRRPLEDDLICRPLVVLLFLCMVAFARRSLAVVWGQTLFPPAAEEPLAVPMMVPFVLKVDFWQIDLLGGGGGKYILSCMENILVQLPLSKIFWSHFYSFEEIRPSPLLECLDDLAV